MSAKNTGEGVVDRLAPGMGQDGFFGYSCCCYCSNATLPGCLFVDNSFLMGKHVFIYGYAMSILQTY